MSCRLEDARPGSVAAALASLFDRHESLRCDYVPGTCGEPFERRLLPPGVVEFEAVPLGRHDTAEAAHEALVGHLAVTANPVSWPFSGFVTIADEEDVTLFAAFDHVTFDGYSMYSAADEIPRLHRVFAAGDAPDPELSLTGSHLDHAAAERDFTASLTAADPRLAAWRGLLDSSGRVPGLPTASGVRRGDRLSHEMVSLPIASPDEAEQFTELCRSWGVSSALSYVALLLRAIAAHEASGPSTVAAMMSTHGRSPAHLGALGWFAGVAPLALVVDPAADLRSTILETAAAWQRSAPSGRIPLSVVGDLLDTSVEPGLVVSYMDSKRVPGWREWARTRARGFLGPVPRSDQMHAWINCLPSGTYLEARHPETPQCARWVATLAVTMRSTLLSSLDPRHAFVPAAMTPGD